MQGIILIGFMGAGKTTIGKLLAKRTGMEHIDFDDKILEEIGMTIEEYFDLYGEEAFREKETGVLKKNLGTHQIISTGGGIVLKSENRELLKQIPTVVYLKTSPEIFISRIKQDDKIIRPVVVSKTPEEIVKVFQTRISLYEECAKFVVGTDDLSPEEIVEEILFYVGRERHE